MSRRTYLDYITLPCKASLVITNVWTRFPCPCTVIDRRRCHAEPVAYEVHSLMGISTNGTILSSLFPYIYIGINQISNTAASFSMTTFTTQTASSSIRTCFGRGVDIGFSACIVIVYPPTAQNDVYIARRGSARYDIVRKSVEGIILRTEGEQQRWRERIFQRTRIHEAFIFRPGFIQSICIFPRHPTFRRSTANKFDVKTDPGFLAPQYFISRD